MAPLTLRTRGGEFLGGRNACPGRTQQEIFEDMAAGAVFPPIVVFFDGAEYWLADGFHRVIAAEALDLAEISADMGDKGIHTDSRGPMTGWASYRGLKAC
jgi:hypothetical protein